MEKQEPSNIGNVVLKHYSLRELGMIYGVDWRTFKTWIEPYKEEIGPKKGWYYTIPQVRIIFDKLGLPSMIDDAA